MLGDECREAERVKGTNDTAQTTLGYDAYFGTYTVNAKEHVVTHHLESALFPGDIGKDIKREFEIAGDTLTIRFHTTLRLRCDCPPLAGLRRTPVRWRRTDGLRASLVIKFRGESDSPMLGLGLLHQANWLLREPDSPIGTLFLLISSFELMSNRQNKYDILGRNPPVFRHVAISPT
jgi:lipocalin-like protein